MGEERTPQEVATAEALARGASSLAPEALAAVSPLSDSKVENGLARKREHLWKVHAYTNDYIRFADAKAAFCIGIASVLMGALFASKSHELFIGAAPSQRVGPWTFLAVLSLGAFLLLGISIVGAVTVVRPRPWTHSEKGFIFWEDISEFDSPSEFSTEYNAQTIDELDECLSHHLYSLAKVCRRKYFWANLAILTGIGGGALAAAVLLLKH